MKTVVQLVQADNQMRLGNHSVVLTPKGRDFIYFETVICAVDDMVQTFRVNNGGYWTSSTARAISAYRSNLSSTHIELIELEITRKKRNGDWVATDQVGKEWELNPEEHPSFITFEKGKKYDAVVRRGKITLALNIKELEGVVL